MWAIIAPPCAGCLLMEGPVNPTTLAATANVPTNEQVMRAVCALLDDLRSDPAGCHERLITFVADRPGHDRRYAVDVRKIECELGWRPRESFDSGLERTVRWYLGNAAWVRSVQSRLVR